jgi:thiosulfate/3-mercaptopyruvate sulfurtransferase
MFLVSEEFLTTAHGVLGCITCHGGENASVKEEAHSGMLAYPSTDFERTCGDCHGNVTSLYKESIHYNLHGMEHGLQEFTNLSSLSDSPEHYEVFEEDCFKCHATCGDCHVSRPKNYTPGLIDEHMFFDTPPMDQTCYGCHNARNAGEYMGNIGFGSDVHYDMGMTCMDCHPVSNFHGASEPTYNMWDEELPSCLDCHSDKHHEEATDVNHTIHGDSLSCQVCHAQANNNCFECHLDFNAEGTHLQSSSESRIMFKIGYNPEITEERPYTYVVLRHVPTQETMLEVVGDDMLPNYHDKANWKYSPTHNIQKSTFQNESCASCHDNTRIWLTENDIRDTDSEANYRLIPALPPPLS